MKRYEHSYSFGAIIDRPFEETVEAVRAELAKEGFGILTEIDVAATLKEKLDVDFRRYVILGACNPALAFQALTTDIETGLLLPCNIVVYDTDEPGRTAVSIMDPKAALAMSGQAALRSLASDARTRLERVVAGLSKAAVPV